MKRSRAGKVWVGFFHLWTTDANGRRVRTKKEKTLGPASLPKHEAQEKLAAYISEYTGRLAKQGDSNPVNTLVEGRTGWRLEIIVTLFLVRRKQCRDFACPET